MNFVDWGEIDMPKAVYKYRTWSDKYHKTILTNLQVFMSPPLGFEDPHDCKNLIRYDLLTSNEIFWKYHQESLERNPRFTPEQHEGFAQYWFERSPLHDKDFIKQQQEKDFIEEDKRLGILSLTTNPINNSMWEKYSENHCGFCVGFHSEIMFKFLGGGGAVNYCDELPIIKPTPWDDYNMQHLKQVYYKLRKWSFEEEYRTQKFSYEPLTVQNRTITLPSEAYKEIIFGAKMNEKDMQEIISICKYNLSHIEFYQAVLNNSNDNVSIEKYNSR